MMSCEGSAGEEAGILNAMLYRAADMGGDAIVLNVPQVSAESVSVNKMDLDGRDNALAVMKGYGAGGLIARRLSASRSRLDENGPEY